ncbi:restriction endonuclease subunit M [Enemella evansiae]|uniref:Eco57I restriction-modification methylase domain-containing protein n=1 Tax=Enemella evansiae TaxID=2016499 RepID=UPI000B9659D7|nr:DNA methyltransferase [Enemella evansiae]OYN99944.1 restriction endonuclease subunit M [Enemella evansiae]
MPTSDALVVVEDWISEHYFTTDATKESFTARVLERRKSWDEADESVRDRFTAARNQLGLDLAALYAAGDEHNNDPEMATRVQQTLLGILGYAAGGWSTTTTGPITTYTAPGMDDAASLAVLQARPLESVEQVFAKDADTIDPTDFGDQQYTSMARLLSALFVGDHAPDWALVLAGRWLIVAEKARWAEGRCLAIDIQTVADRNETRRGGEIDRALTCVEATSLTPKADGGIWWDSVLEDSVKHTVGVSKDLREGVRLSIEIIANDVIERRREQGLEPLPAEAAQPLAIEALRYLYRILFLLYAEASPEMGVLPAGDVGYDQGYSLDRLRELVLVELTSPQARRGTHFHDSFAVLFRLVDSGHTPSDPAASDGLTFHGLRADLFTPSAIARIDEVKLSNHALQQVLRKLLLSKESRSIERGFISYVDLGINQLGAVYEGLMSYTGFFATEDLYEVAPAGNPEKGSWVVPVDRADDLAREHFVTVQDVTTGERVPVLHRRGTFVFRLSGRQRQQSASYYTPEVLTRFTVGQALAELLDRDDHITTADEILRLSICEPALGSGAFAIEAVRQLAEEYLTRRQAELGEQVDPGDRPQVVQRIKAQIALHQVYGVDLNATAVELAEISLWLDTMAAGLDAPWFGLRLRRGNSLIGARHAVFTESDLKKRRWLTTPALDVPLTNLVTAVDADRPFVEGIEGRIHHFLLPAHGWGAAAESREAKTLVPEQAKRIKSWARSLRRDPSKPQLKRLTALAERAETLWRLAWRRLVIAEGESQRSIDIWGMPATAASGAAVTREQIESSLADPDGAYRRLRLVMDAWCALWFWPTTGVDDVELPSFDTWLSALEGILGRSYTNAKSLRGGQHPLAVDGWEALAEAERLDLDFAHARPIDAVLADHPWLKVTRKIAERHGFFHWELDFAGVFGRGGFDLQVGNPPWVRPRTDVDALLADHDPWWALAHKPSESERATRRDATLTHPGATATVLEGVDESVGTAEFLGHMTTYPVLSGLQPDTYRCFMARTWANRSADGVISLIHPETHFTDEKAARLRRQTYRRLRRHWQFVNELQLFEIHHLVNYGVHVYGAQSEPEFLNASSLYHPQTVEGSLVHNGLGDPPGLKNDDGKWDLRAHAQRIVTVTEDVLTVWRDVLEDGSVPESDTRMLYTVNAAAGNVLAKLSTAPRIGSLGLKFSSGWHEKMDRSKGRFEQRWGAPERWADVILQGPHLHVNNPAYKIPNKTMKHNQDWSEVDLEALPADSVPVTAYKPAGDRSTYDADYTHWSGESARDFYRVAWRRMAANTGERTLIAILLPPGAAHVHPVHSAAVPGSLVDLIKAQATATSLLADFSVRTSPKADINPSTMARLAVPRTSDLQWAELFLRTLRLNCLTDAYADLWNECWNAAYQQDSWVLQTSRTLLQGVGPEWTSATPLRLALDRRNAQVEIDALVALMLGVTADELCTVYRTQFAVLRSYDKDKYIYDANGRLVPTPILQAWRKNPDLTEDQRTHTNAAGNTYVHELPFTAYDREADMRTAYAEFERRFGGARHDE